jgi:hypothetical protein
MSQLQPKDIEKVIEDLSAAHAPLKEEVERMENLFGKIEKYKEDADVFEREVEKMLPDFLAAFASTAASFEVQFGAQFLAALTADIKATDVPEAPVAAAGGEPEPKK